MKDKPIYQPWCEDQFNADHNVQKMDSISRWIYRTLLQASFFCSTRPYLPAEDSELWMLAGCDDEKTWKKHKKSVLPMFTEIEKRGRKLLARKRVVEDWQKIEKIRLRNKQNIQKRWTPKDDTTVLPEKYDRNTAPIQVKLSKDKLREVRESEDMRKENYRVQCIRIGLKADPDNSGSWRDLKDMCEAFGDDAVLEQFERWLVGKDNIRYPISLFVRDLPSLMQSPGSKKDDEALDNLAMALYKIGGSVFSGKSLTALGELRTEFSDKEITQAWGVFVTDEADSFPSNWPKKFTEGAGRILIKTIRDDVARQKADKLASEAAIEQMRVEDARVRAAREAEAAQEASDLDILMSELENEKNAGKRLQ